MLRTTSACLLSLAAVSPALAASGEFAPDSIVVSASRSGEGIAADRLGASVSVLEPEEIEDRQTRTVSDVLRDVPGVAVSRAIGGLTQLRLRGAEANHTLVLIDGIEASDPFNGEFDFNALIAEPGMRIEVLRGQQSSLYGSDAIGGVVHYITRGGAEAPGATVRAEAGSFGTWDGAARLAGVGGALDYVFSGTLYRTRGTPVARGGTRDVGTEAAGLNARLAWSPDERFTLSGVARYGWTDYDVGLTEQNPASPRFGTVVDSPGAHATRRSFYALIRAEHVALDGRWTNALTGQYADVTRKGYAAGARDSGSNGRRTKGSYESSLRLGDEAVVHRLTAALDVEREAFRNTTPGGFAFTGRRHTDNVGLVGQYELTLEDIATVGASVRHDWNDRFADTTTWRVQGSYALAEGTRVHAAYGTGVKNPGYFDLFGYVDGQYIGNPNLNPEKSRGWEAGIEQSFGNLARVGATWFDSTLEDEIFVTYPAPAFLATPGNLATESTQRGIELALSARPLPRLRLEAAYTWLDAAENGAVEVRRARHIGSFNATWSSTDERLSATLTVRYNGSQRDLAFTDPSYVPVNVRLDDYVLVNLAAEYRLSGAVTLFGRVENLFDEDYEEVFSYATPGIGAFGGVRVRF